VLLVSDGAAGFRVSGLVDCGKRRHRRPLPGSGAVCPERCGQSRAGVGTGLFARYGVEHVDEQKVAYYQLLDEFF
jgi:aminoglycoside phosphotransferase